MTVRSNGERRTTVRRVPLRLLAGIAVLGAAISLGAIAVARADSHGESNRARTPIEHFIVLMQENHSFDNYFGAYPGANGPPADTCIPRDPDDPGLGCVAPFALGTTPVLDLPHSNRTFREQYNDGRMDGFLQATGGQDDERPVVMGYYTGDDLPYYWNIADEYVLFDRLFQSSSGGSVGNHMYWVAGVFGEDAVTEEGAFPEDIVTIFDRLQEAGVSWKFYIQNYDPDINYRTKFDVPPNRAAQIVWAPVLAFERFLDDPQLSQYIVNMDEYFIDLEQGTLPAVAYMVPSGASEHPPGSILAGQRMVRNLINNLMRSQYWDNSAFMWTYDDWGGFYDHVPPPQVDEFGYGFRVPALLVSSYARRGAIVSDELDFTSILRFIEDNWGLEPMAERDRNATSIAGAFDFDQPPREPAFLPTTRETVVAVEPNRPAFYATYAGALGLSILIGVVAVLVLRPSAGRRKE